MLDIQFRHCGHTGGWKEKLGPGPDTLMSLFSSLQASSSEWQWYCLWRGILDICGTFFIAMVMGGFVVGPQMLDCSVRTDTRNQEYYFKVGIYFSTCPIRLCIPQEKEFYLVSLCTSTLAINFVKSPEFCMIQIS